MWVFDLVNQFILLLDWLFDAFSWAVPTFKFGFMIISIFATALNSAVLIKVILEFYHLDFLPLSLILSQDTSVRSCKIDKLCCLSWVLFVLGLCKLTNYVVCPDDVHHFFFFLDIWLTCMSHLELLIYMHVLVGLAFCFSYFLYHCYSYACKKGIYLVLNNRELKHLYVDIFVS